jgi:chromosome segregation ATPase
MKTLNTNYKKKRENLGIVKKKFNHVKNQRRYKFNEFFNSVAEQIDGIFKVRKRFLL